MAGNTEYQADIVVIGGGLAGMVAALELLDAGKRVVLLDRASRYRFGGLARWSFGGIFFVDSPEQRKNGIKDSVDLAMRDWVRYGELDPNDVWPYRWAEAYVNRCTEEVRDWLHQRDVRLFRAVNWTERGYFVPGNSVPRFHIARRRDRASPHSAPRRARKSRSVTSALRSQCWTLPDLYWTGTLRRLTPESVSARSLARCARRLPLVAVGDPRDGQGCNSLNLM